MFLADLERVEISGPAAVERSISRWFVDTAPPSPVADASASLAQVTLGIAGFLVMMGVGGAAAAYVFADRVALILESVL